MKNKNYEIKPGESETIVGGCEEETIFCRFQRLDRINPRQDSDKERIKWLSER